MAKRLTEDEQKMERSERRWGDTLSIWALCAKAPCRRAQACRGADARVCFGRYCHMLPEGVRDWFLTLGEAQAAGVPFDEAREELERLGLNDALADWRDAAQRANGVRKVEQRGRSPSPLVGEGRAEGAG